jgi:hypothetical protein
MLGALVTQLERRVNALEAEMTAILAAPIANDGRRQAEHITFELQNIWEMYVRNFILLSATGRAIGAAGRLPASAPYSFRSREAVCAYLLTQRGYKFEPKWYRPTDAIKAAQRLQIHNLTNLTAAIGSTPWPLEELRLTRNFFAHRSRSAALELRALNWFSPGDIIAVETTVMPFGLGGVRRFDGWCASMKLIAGAML